MTSAQRKWLTSQVIVSQLWFETATPTGDHDDCNPTGPGGMQGPGTFGCSRSGSQHVVNQQDRATLETPVRPGSESPSHGFDPRMVTQTDLSVTQPHSSKDPLETGTTQPVGDLLGKESGVVKSPPERTQRMHRHRHDHVRRHAPALQSRQHQPGQFVGKDGETLVLVVADKRAERSFVRSTGQYASEGMSARATFRTVPSEHTVRSRRSRTSGTLTSLLLRFSNDPATRRAQTFADRRLGVASQTSARIHDADDGIQHPTEQTPLPLPFDGLRTLQNVPSKQQQLLCHRATESTENNNSFFFLTKTSLFFLSSVLSVALWLFCDFRVLTFEF